MLPASDLLLFSFLTPFSFSSRKDACFSAGSTTVFYIIENSAFFVRIVPPDFFSLRKRYAWFSVLPVPRFLYYREFCIFYQNSCDSCHSVLSVQRFYCCIKLAMFFLELLWYRTSFRWRKNVHLPVHVACTTIFTASKNSSFVRQNSFDAKTSFP